MGRLLAAFALLTILVSYMVLFGMDQFNPNSIRGQRVLVTGASMGIGEQLAYQYAKLGARLVISARKSDLLLKVSRSCLDLGASEVHFVAADMAAPGDRSKVIEHVLEHLGGLDTLILNHAILTDGWWTGSAQNLTLLEQVQHVNFLSYVDIASKALPMLNTSKGRIGVVSSALGQVGSILSTAYCPSKFALHGFFASLRQELRHKNSGVSVTLVLLGPVSSDTLLKNRENANMFHVPISFMATPQDAAQEVLESVARRRYKTIFDWKTRIMLFFNDFFPQYTEEFLANLMLNDDGFWSTRIMFFVWRNFY